MTGTAVIDGARVEIRAGETILAGARRAGADVPTLCHADGLSPEGGCRLCLVEVEGAPRPVAACTARLEPGAVVRTDGERLHALRRDVLRLHAAAHPMAFAAARTGSELHALMERLAVAPPIAPRPARPAGSHPYVRFSSDLCVTCRRCVRACEELPGRFVYSVLGRGADARLAIGAFDEHFGSACSSCGACVDACPTGALDDVDRLGGPAPERSVETTCGYCGVGCRLRVEVAAGGEIARIEGVADAAVNRGHACVKGRYAHGFRASPERLVTPLLREGGGFRAIGWDEALAWAARRLREVREAAGPRAIGLLTSSRSTNEAAYLLQRAFRSILGTNNVDCCARVCHSSTALALRIATGTGAATSCYDDVELAARIFVAGANPTEAHPVIGDRIQQAVLRGARLVVADPRRTRLAELAEVHLQLHPGTNVALFNGLAKVMLEEGLVDREHLARRCEGLDALAEHLGRVELDDVARRTRVPAERIVAAARVLGAGPTLHVSGLGLSELTQGTASVLALANLAMFGGSPGTPGAGLLPLRGQNNVQGNADMGASPDLVTGYQRLDDPDVRRRLERAWGAAPPAEAGWTIPEMYDAARRGDLRALWIQGEDVAQSDPDETSVRAALASLELLVVQEAFMSETARLAHLVLPAAVFLENEGTFTNAERRIQAVVPVGPPPGEARPDWLVARDLARALGEPWPHASPADVIEEIARVAPALFGGVRWDRLGRDGLQWPCPDATHPNAAHPDAAHPNAAHPATARLHVDGYVRGKGRLTVVEPRPGPEDDVPGHPYVLITGRVLDHYNVGTMTRRTPQLALAPEDVLEIAPDDAVREGLADGDRVVVASRWGSTEVPVRRSPRMSTGCVFLSFHHPATHANRLTGPHHDPDSHCPDYKVTAVRIERV